MELERRKKNKLTKYYPDTGPLRRELYEKHTAFFAAGAISPERLVLAANRVGKSEGIGGYEAVVHATGRYPSWWVGHRFKGQIKLWVAGDTSKTVREILQEKLLGPWGNFGTGLIPADDIIRWGNKSGLQDAVDTVYVRHRDPQGNQDGVSILTFKSYDQRREAFQGTEQHVIWLDEEPPIDIYAECLIRTMTVKGLILCTFTPMMGMSQTVMHFLHPELSQIAGGYSAQTVKRFIITATWDDVPHLSADDKARLWQSLPPHQRDARSKGIPQLGSGAIFPIAEEDIKVKDFPIPDHWQKWYGLDFGWEATAAAFFARNPETGQTFIYSTYKAGHEKPVVHAAAIKARGSWIPGASDPSKGGVNLDDGHRLIEDYVNEGLDLVDADNTVEAGLYQMWQAMAAGQLKVFASCVNWFDEFRLYRRDDKGRVVKQNDHLMDASRYAKLTDYIAKAKPLPRMMRERFEGPTNRTWLRGTT